MRPGPFDIPGRHASSAKVSHRSGAFMPHVVPAHYTCRGGSAAVAGTAVGIQPQDAQAFRTLARALSIAVAYLCLQCLFLEIRHHETDLLHNGKSIMESDTREYALGVEHVLTHLDHNKMATPMARY